MMQPLNHSLSRRRFLALAGAGSAGLVAAACAPDGVPTGTPAPDADTAEFEPATVRFATIAGILDNAIWMIGRDQGFFEEYAIDLDVQLLRDDSVVVQAVLAGETDFADGGAGAPLSALEGGGDLRIIGGSRPRVGFVVYVQQGIESLQDLEGRTIALPAAGSLPYLMMLTLLEQEGVDIDRVDIANVGATPMIYQALAAGTVDAGPSLVAFLPRAEGDNLVPLVDMWRALPDYMANVFYANNSLIESRSDAIARAMAGLAKSYRYALTPEAREPFVAAAVEQLNAAPDQAEFYWNFMRENPEVLALNLEITPAQLEFSQGVNLRFGSQERIVPFDEATDLSPQERALELAGRV